MTETREFYSWAGTLLNYRLDDCGQWWIYIYVLEIHGFFGFFYFHLDVLLLFRASSFICLLTAIALYACCKKEKKKSETIIPLLIGNCVAFVRGDCAGQVPSLSTHSMYINGMQYFSLSVHQYIIKCVLCVLFLLVFRVCSAILFCFRMCVFECYW